MGLHSEWPAAVFILSDNSSVILELLTFLKMIPVINSHIDCVAIDLFIIFKVLMVWHARIRTEPYSRIILSIMIVLNAKYLFKMNLCWKRH